MAITISWLNRLLSGRSSSAGRVGLSVGPDGLGLAAVDKSGQLNYCRYVEELGDLSHTLQTLVDEQSWQGMACSIVLHPVYYQLLLAEQPAVEGSEMTSAVRWKIKELIDFPIEEAAIEHFLLPDDAYRGRQKMLYAAALRKTNLQSLVEPVEETGLNVDCVEVAELAMHKLIARLPSEGGGIALLQFQDGESFINLVEGGELYLTRRLDAGLAEFTSGGGVSGDTSRFFDSLFLEVQRSLDYYESQLGKGIITRLFYSPGLAVTRPIGDFLSTQLGIEVAALNLEELDFISGPAAIDNRCASAIGAALGCNQGTLDQRGKAEPNKGKLPEVASAAS